MFKEQLIRCHSSNPNHDRIMTWSGPGPEPDMGSATEGRGRPTPPSSIFFHPHIYPESMHGMFSGVSYFVALAGILVLRARIAGWKVATVVEIV
jgi:hypothetical protein